MVYGIILLMIVIGIFFFDFGNISYKKTYKRNYYIFIAVLLYLLVLFQYNMGSDGVRYLKAFNSLPDLSRFDIKKNYYNFEIGWLYLNLIVKTVFNNFNIVLLLSIGIFNIIIYYFIYRESPYPFTCLFAFYTLSFFHFNFEIFRQVTCMIFYYWGIMALLNNDRRGYLYKAFPCIFFHSSGIIIYILTYLISFVKIKRYMLYIILAVFVLATISSTIFSQYFNLVDNLGEHYTNKLQYYSNLDEYGAKKLSWFSFLFRLFATILSPCLIINYWINKKKNLPLCQLLFIYTLFQSLSPTLAIFYRFKAYLEVVYYISAINFVLGPLNVSGHQIIRNLNKSIVGFSLFLSIIFNMNFYLSSKKFGDNNGIDYRYFPYTSIFNENDQVIQKRTQNFYLNRKR